MVQATMSGMGKTLKQEIKDPLTVCLVRRWDTRVDELQYAYYGSKDAAITTVRERKCE